MVSASALHDREVDEEAGGEEEGRDEQRVGGDLQLLDGEPPAQGALQGEAGEEGADDALELDQATPLGRQSERDHDDQKPRLGCLAKMDERLAREPAEAEQDRGREDRDLDELRAEEAPPEAALVNGHRHRQHEHRRDVGEDRAADGDRHGLVAEDAEPLEDRVGQQGVGGDDRADEQRRDPGVAEGPAQEDAGRERDGEGQASEDDRA
jgi:hypothetical protein